MSAPSSFLHLGVSWSVAPVPRLIIPARQTSAMRSFVLVACLACVSAFSLTAAPQSTRVVVAASSAEVVMVCKLTLTHACLGKQTHAAQHASELMRTPAHMHAHVGAEL